MRRRTLKNKKKGAGLFDGITKTMVADNDLVTLTIHDRSIQCLLCSENKFQRRYATLDKSKMANVATDIFLGDDAQSLIDISIKCYFCNNCANAIVVRDSKVTTDNTYQNLIVATKIDSQ